MPFHHDHEIALRTAQIDDSNAMGRVHVQCWKEAYSGLLPNTILNTLDAEKRSLAWKRIIETSQGNHEISVFVATINSEIVGLASVNKQSSEALLAQGYQGEFSSIYVLNAYQGIGLGRALMQRMASDLEYRGVTSASLWVLNTNTNARRFYEHLGGIVVGEKQEKRGDTLLKEVAYGWDDIHVINTPCP